MLTGAFPLLSVLALLVAAGYYLLVTSRQFILHLVVIVSFVLNGIGSLFKVLHWTGADELLMVSYTGWALGAFLLIWTGLRNPTGKILHYQLITGILIGLMVANSLYRLYELDPVMKLLPYPMAGLTATILLREVYVHQGEKNVVNMFFIVSIIVVIDDLIRLF